MKKALLTILFIFLITSLIFATDIVKAVSVGDAATEILSHNPNRRSFVIYNNGSSIVYIGFTSSVNTSTGLPLLPTVYMKVIGKGESVYGIVVTGTCEVRAWETTR